MPRGTVSVSELKKVGLELEAQAGAQQELGQNADTDKKDGDDFTVYADDGSVLWHGIIHQDTTTGLIPRQVLLKDKLVNDRTWKQQVVGGMWVRWVQAGIDPEVWGELFVGNKRCLLKRAEPIALQD